MKHIVRYLKDTNTKGYILNPSSENRLDFYVDADFAGTWTLETSNNPLSVRARTEYIITFANCPVLWSSKLQTEIALSPTEAEYIVLSQAMRDIIPMRVILSELSAICQVTISASILHTPQFLKTIKDVLIWLRLLK